MLDLKQIRSDPGRYREALARRGAAEALDELLELDGRRRELLPEIEEGRARRNTASEAIAESKRRGRTQRRRSTRCASSRAGSRARGELAEVETHRDELAATLPNLPDPEAPDGLTEEDALVLREVGERPEFDFDPRDHLEIGTALGLIEVEAAARVSGSRFAYLMGSW